MGKGDKKTAKGKRARGSYGITRKRNSDSTATAAPAKPKVKKATPAAEKKEVVKKAPVKKEVAPKKEAAPKKESTKTAAAKKPAAKKAD